MIPVKQTLFPDPDVPGKGNCFASCLASILELPLADVPHVMMHNDWRQQTNRWLAERFGLGLVEVDIENNPPRLFHLPPKLLVIVSGRTERHATRLHSVIGRVQESGCTWEYLHDPHPDDTFLTAATMVMWLVPLDPVKR